MGLDNQQLINMKLDGSLENFNEKRVSAGWKL